MCALFAATYPDRTSALILYGAFARRVGTRLSLGPARERFDRFAEEIGT